MANILAIYSVTLGQRFVQLTVTDPVPSMIEMEGFANRTSSGAPIKRAKIRLRCDCGNEVYAAPRELHTGAVKSCGCRRSLFLSKKGADRPWLVAGSGAISRLFNAYQQGAKKRGIPWELTKDQMLAVIWRDCAYCGAKPGNRLIGPTNFGGIVYSGIDRVENSGPYAAGNVVPCCEQCNTAKSDRSYADFVAHAVRVVALAERGPCAELDLTDARPLEVFGADEAVIPTKLARRLDRARSTTPVARTTASAWESAYSASDQVISAIRLSAELVATRL